ncbi:hypothetical protein LCGC14_0430260 [marine sediment metagenome]|uniref:Uncharacterized protein n=1 Tax=marine sediment metagenome TaxID=412755 RepID=A0A0F9SNI6_9ZZZZ
MKQDSPTKVTRRDIYVLAKLSIPENEVSGWKKYFESKMNPNALWHLTNAIIADVAFHSHAQWGNPSSWDGDEEDNFGQTVIYTGHYPHGKEEQSNEYPSNSHQS